MKIYKVVLFLITLNLGVYAEPAKHTLLPNYMINYDKSPSSVENLSEMLSEGMLYGRLRTNWFFYEYEDDNILQESHNILGLGGSLLYKTASYSGFSAMVGAYYTSAGAGLDNHPSSVALLKAGKDTISRYNSITGSGSSYATLAQAYLEYQYSDLKTRVGRQIFNSFFTKSNDSKMIPNTFEGFTLESENFYKTRIKLAYLTRQKLRDHDSFHSVIMYDNSNKSTFTQWNGNDDSAVHRGLNTINFRKISQEENPALIVLDAQTKGVMTEELKLSTSLLYLEDLFITAMVELNYRIDLGSGYILTPGLRYVQQFDEGAGEIGGASLSGLAASDANGGTASVRGSYTDPSSVDSYMTAARLVLKKDAGSVSLGYTQIADEADFITPWRGFITSGYTRAMARYNWLANTKTVRLRGSYYFSGAGLADGLKTYASITHENYDDKKVFAKDANVYYAGLIKDIQEVPNLSCRLRTEYVEQVAGLTNDHAELRMELNYLF